MKAFELSLLLHGWAVGLTALAAPMASAASWKLVQADRVIVDARKPAMGPATVVIEDGRIVEVVPGRVHRRALPEGDHLEVVDLGPRTVLPGLLDAHVHFEIEPQDTYWLTAVRSDAAAAVISTANALTTLKAGFTTVRDAGSSAPDTVFAVRDAIAAGRIQGPRVIAAGAIISSVGGHGDVHGFRREVYPVMAQLSGEGTCTGAVECTKAVRRMAKFGADVIKITATGGVLSERASGLGQQFAAEELQAITQAAHQLGVKVLAHAHSAAGVRSAAEAGVDSIEHGTYADAAALDAMKRSGSYFVATLMAYRGLEEGIAAGQYTPAVTDKAKTVLQTVGSVLKQAHRRGVRIALGTDAGVFAHGRNAEELPMMRDYGGMSERDVLIAATINTAELLGVLDEVGTLEPGKTADLIAVDADPLADLSTFEQVPFVMARGAIIVRP